jgi:prepilin-type N-terminal cleavage/methylation domain-containing protein
MMRAARQKGLTLVEVMVSLVVVGIAAGLIFGVQTRMTGALRDQQNIAEAQQTLRSSAAILVKDSRQAGYMAANTHTALKGSPTADTPAVAVLNGANGAPDQLNIQYAIDNVLAHVCDSNGIRCPKAGPDFNASETEVDDNSGFQNGDVVYAVYIGPCTDNNGDGICDINLFGTGCILAITNAPQSNAAGNNQKIQHNPGAGAPWNEPTNKQCDVLNSVWNSGYTVFTHVRLRGYRIKPDDPRGVLQMSPTQGEQNDWQDVALGVIDMQFAMRVYHPNQLTDLDGDGDNQRDWFSGDEMATVLSDYPGSQLLMLSVTLVAKSTKGVNAPNLPQVPSLMDPNWSSTDPAYNRLSDKGPVTLPDTGTTWPDTMYGTDVVYRVFTTTIDLRNVGIGVDGHS